MGDKGGDMGGDFVVILETSLLDVGEAVTLSPSRLPALRGPAHGLPTNASGLKLGLEAPPLKRAARKDVVEERPLGVSAPLGSSSFLVPGEVGDLGPPARGISWKAM